MRNALNKDHFSTVPVNPHTVSDPDDFERIDFQVRDQGHIEYSVQTAEDPEVTSIVTNSQYHPPTHTRTHTLMYPYTYILTSLKHSTFTHSHRLCPHIAVGMPPLTLIHTFVHDIHTPVNITHANTQHEVTSIVTNS